MAKKRKNKRDIYTTAGRVDMRNGGRVAYQTGGQPKTEEEFYDDYPEYDGPKGGGAAGAKRRQQYKNERDEAYKNYLRDYATSAQNQIATNPTPQDTTNTTPNTTTNNTTSTTTDTNTQAPVMPRGPFTPGFGNVEPGEYPDSEKPDATGAMKRPTPIGLQDPAGESPFQIGREYRVLRTGAEAENLARTGQVAEQAVIPDAVQVGIDPATGQPIRDQQITTMDATTPVTARPASMVSPEQVTTVKDTAQITQPQAIQAAQMTAATVDPIAQVTAAQGQISDDSLAQAAGVDRVEKIDAAQVNIPEGALTERVIGVLSEDAKSTAAVNAGSSLARISRAKQQLSNAGLSSEQINELGNDPQALEARLADFNESERGLIAGLPQEALVSNQLDALLTGIEDGNIPAFARPAVAQVEQMLAQRGLEASTVGRDALVNAIIQSAIPLAQSNAQAIQQSVARQQTIEAQESEANTARRQQTALTNAQNVFNLNLAQFNADQQTALSNSKFLQTVGFANATAEQQGIIQDAVLMSQANLAEANFNQQAQIQNAQAFLQMDFTNLSNRQQANVLKAQQTQQRILSNQAAENAASQFNSTSENQTNQFMAGLQVQANQFNVTQMNAMQQFNATQSNAAAARDAAREADLEKFNAQLVAQVDQFNSQQDFARNQWNAQNAAVVEASNVQWRRQANTVNTAAQNQINMQNAMNSFNLSSQAMSFLWQELRDEADFTFRAVENEENRKAQILATAIANEGKAGERYDDFLTDLLSSVEQSYKAGLFGGSS